MKYSSTFILFIVGMVFTAGNSPTGHPCNDYVMKQVEYMEEVNVVHTHNADTTSLKPTPQFGAYVYLSTYVDEKCVFTLVEKYDNPCVRAYAFAALVYRDSRYVKKGLDALVESNDSITILDAGEYGRKSLTDFAEACLLNKNHIKTYGL